VNRAYTPIGLCGWGSAPNPRWGAYSAPADPQLQGCFTAGRKVRVEKQEGRERKEGGENERGGGKGG